MTHVVVAPVGADGTLTVGQPLNVAWVWPLQAEPAYLAVAGIYPINPDDARRPGAHRPARAPGRPARGEPRRAADARSEPRDPRRVERAGDEVPRARALDRLRIRSTHRPQPGARGTVRAPRPPVARARRPRRTSSTVERTDRTERAHAWRRRARDVPRRADVEPEHRAPGPLDASSLSHPAERQRAPARRRRRTRSRPVTEKFTPAHPYKVQTVAGDDSSAATVARHRHRPRAVPHRRRAARAARRAPPGRARARRRRATEHPARRRHRQPGRLGRQRHLRRRGARRAARQPARPPDDRGQALLQAVPVATVDDQPDGAPVFRQLAPYSPPAPPVTAAQYASGVKSRDAVAAGRAAERPARRQRRPRAGVVGGSRRGRTPAGRAGGGSSPRVDPRPRSTTTSARSRCSRGSTVTITSSKAEIPISFKNNGDDQVTVHLRLDSDRLLFPEGAEQDVTLPPKHNTTVRVAVETRGSGTVPGAHDRHDARWARHRQATTIKVRSTFVSGVGVFLTVGAIVFLAIWWGWDIHRRRKKRAREQHPTYRLAPPSGQPA